VRCENKASSDFLLS